MKLFYLFDVSTFSSFNMHFVNNYYACFIYLFIHLFMCMHAILFVLYAAVLS